VANIAAHGRDTPNSSATDSRALSSGKSIVEGPPYSNRVSVDRDTRQCRSRTSTATFLSRSNSYLAFTKRPAATPSDIHLRLIGPRFGPSRRTRSAYVFNIQGVGPTTDLYRPPSLRGTLYEDRTLATRRLHLSSARTLAMAVRRRCRRRGKECESRRGNLLFARVGGGVPGVHGTSGSTAEANCRPGNVTRVSNRANLSTGPGTFTPAHDTRTGNGAVRPEAGTTALRVREYTGKANGRRSPDCERQVRCFSGRAGSGQANGEPRDESGPPACQPARRLNVKVEPVAAWRLDGIDLEMLQRTSERCARPVWNAIWSESSRWRKVSVVRQAPSSSARACRPAFATIPSR